MRNWLLMLFVLCKKKKMNIDLKTANQFFFKKKVTAAFNPKIRYKQTKVNGTNSWRKYQLHFLLLEMKYTACTYCFLSKGGQ